MIIVDTGFRQRRCSKCKNIIERGIPHITYTTNSYRGSNERLCARCLRKLSEELEKALHNFFAEVATKNYAKSKRFCQGTTIKNR